MTRARSSSSSFLASVTGLLVACGDPGGDDPPGATSSPGETDSAETAPTGATAGSEPGSSGGESDSQSASAETSNDVSGSEESGADTGEPELPDGVLFFDGFDYLVEREEPDKFGDASEFRAHGWSWGKDAVINGPGAGGWLYTTPTVPGDTTGLPGVDSTHALCVEAKAGTYANTIDGIWRQTDFYLQYGDVEGGPLDTIPADVWIQQWIYIADTPENPSLFPPTNRLGKWFYPTRYSYPSQDLEWLYGITGVLIDSEIEDMGSSAHVEIGDKSLASEFALTDADGTIFTDGRPDGTTGLGHSGTDPDYRTVMTANQWWLLRLHVDHSVDPGVAEVWIRPRGGEWIKTVDTTTSPVIDWNPINTTDGHRGLRFPTTMSNWYQEPEQQTTHGDWWIYIDDFAIAAGEHAGGNGEGDLPSYPW